MRSRPLLALLTLTFGCSDILGLGNYDKGTGGAPSGSGGTAQSGGAGGTAGTGAGGTTGASAGGTGGSGAAGGTGGGTTTSTTTTSTMCVPQTENCATDIDEDCDGNGKCTGACQWKAQIGGTGDAVAAAVTVDHQGNTIVVGTFTGQIKAGNDELNAANMAEEAFIAKLDPKGNFLWAKAYLTNGHEHATAVAVDAQDDVVVGGITLPPGSATYDMFMVRLSPGGDKISENLYSSLSAAPANDERLNGLAVGPSGDVYIVGSYNGASPFPNIGMNAFPAAPNGANNAFVARLDPGSGLAKWAKGYGDAAAQTAQSVTVDVPEDVIVAMTYSGSMQIGGNLLTSAGDADIAVVKLSPNGQYLWGRSFGDAAGQYAGAVQLAPQSKSFVVLGVVSGTVSFQNSAADKNPATGCDAQGGASSDVAVWELAANGTCQWAVRAPGSSSTFALGLAIGPLDDVAVAGKFKGTLDFSQGYAQGAANKLVASAAAPDRYVAKLGPSPDPADPMNPKKLAYHPIWWTRTFPNAGDASTYVAAAPDGGVILATSTPGATDLQGTCGIVSSNAGVHEVLISRLAP